MNQSSWHEIFQRQNNTGYYTQEELLDLGFAEIGSPILLSRKAQILNASKVSLGNFVRIDDFVILSGEIKIGSFVHLGAFSSITGGDEARVEVGDFCGMSSYSKIFALSDDLINGYLVGPCIPNTYRHIIQKHVTLTRHCHIGSHSLVLPGSRFDIGACLGPMSVNLGYKFKAWNYYLGNPAKDIFTIPKDQVLALEEELINHMGGGDRK